MVPSTPEKPKARLPVLIKVRPLDEHWIFADGEIDTPIGSGGISSCHSAAKSWKTFNDRCLFQRSLSRRAGLYMSSSRVQWHRTSLEIPVTHFSLIIGVYLSSMGVGAYASQYFERNLLARFVEIEIIIALIGGLEALLLFAAFAYTSSFHIVLYGLVAVVGMMVGMEIPLLIRLEAKSV